MNLAFVATVTRKPLRYSTQEAKFITF